MNKLEKAKKPPFLKLSVDPIKADRFLGIPFYGFIAGNVDQRTGYLYIQFHSTSDFDKAIKLAKTAVDKVLT